MAEIIPSFCTLSFKLAVLLYWNLSRLPFFQQVLNFDLLLCTGINSEMLLCSYALLSLLSLAEIYLVYFVTLLGTKIKFLILPQNLACSVYHKCIYLITVKEHTTKKMLEFLKKKFMS